MKKRISIFLLLTLVTALLLGGCTKNVEPKETDGDQKTYKFGIISQIENGAFLDMRDGIIAGLENAGYTEENATIDYKCAQGDATTLSTICSTMDDGSYDAVFTIATPATQAFVNMESETPNFFCAVSAPIAAGVITEMETPDKNATGTSNAIPTSDIIDLAYTLTPNVTKFGFIYCTAQANATETVKSACDYLEGKNIDYTVKTVETSDDVGSVTEALIADGADVIFIPNDAVVQSGISALTEICKDEKIPTYCSSATTVASGCLATLAIDDKGIGEKTAAIAAEYFQGKAVETLPSIVVDVDYCTINAALAQKLDVTIPNEETLGYTIKLYEE
ncbi:MAG: ABC transporter substrate-binding protein [Clostridiales bacterium]|jgi:putative ABC transport system substrate-binding protein|nr:ABC transporter substrate-binding protein [Clostridiales bacterium]